MLDQLRGSALSPKASTQSEKLEARGGLSSPGSCLGHWAPTSCPCSNGTFRSMWPTLKGGWEGDRNVNVFMRDWRRCRCVPENQVQQGETVARVDGKFHNPGGWREEDGAMLKALLESFLCTRTDALFKFILNFIPFTFGSIHFIDELYFYLGLFSIISIGLC